jgi:hypothetical protein
MRIEHVVVGGVFALTLIACQKDVVSPESQVSSPITISPSDNEFDVSISSGVYLKFSKTVDRGTVERGLHLISASALSDTTCPTPTTMRHGSMNDVMMDSSIMAHMQKFHSMPGSFTWSNDSLTCVFRPDSLLLPYTQYMIHLDRPMVEMMTGRMGDLGTMGRQAMEGMEDRMLHFTTAPKTTTGGGGHDGHH